MRTSVSAGLGAHDCRRRIRQDGVVLACFVPTVKDLRCLVQVMHTGTERAALRVAQTECNVMTLQFPHSITLISHAARSAAGGPTKPQQPFKRTGKLLLFLATDGASSSLVTQSIVDCGRQDLNWIGLDFVQNCVTLNSWRQEGVGRRIHKSIILHLYFARASLGKCWRQKQVGLKDLLWHSTAL